MNWIQVSCRQDGSNTNGRNSKFVLRASKSRVHLWASPSTKKKKNCLEVDLDPNKDTHKALADWLKLTQRDMKIWFIFWRNKIKLKQSSKAYRMQLTYRVYKSMTVMPPVFPACLPQPPIQPIQNVVQAPSRWTTRQNPEEFSQNTNPGLPETLEALRRLILSSGNQSRDGMSQDFWLLQGGAHLTPWSADA